MNFLLRLLLVLRLLSLDIAIGGVICSLAVAKLYDIELPLASLVCLFLAIWAIYTADHLMDARKMENPTMPRHQFHKRHYSGIRIGLLLTIMVGAGISSLLPTATRNLGVLLSIIVALYFLVLYAKKSFTPKEPIVGVAYAIGVFLGPVSMYGHFTMKWAILFLEISLIAIYNLILFSALEKDKDLKDGEQSWVTQFDDHIVNKHFNSLLVAILLTMVTGLTLFNSDVLFVAFQVVVFFMIGFLEWIRRRPDLFLRNEKYRTLGDAIFLFPGFLLLM